jgi:hypothetical protein
MVLNARGSEIYNLDLSSLDAGVYFAVIINDNQVTYQQKIIIQK